jgi:hypothetical protein
MVAEARANGEQEDLFVVCHNKDFQRKFLGHDLDEQQQRNKHLNNDFGPCYGLEGEQAHSILDWERRAMELVTRQHAGHVQMRYIDKRGKEVKDMHEDYDNKPDYGVEEGTGRPAWYGPAKGSV